MVKIKRLLALQQTEMIDHWDSWFRPIPRQCMDNIRKRSKKTETRHSTLSLKNLTGAFVVLLIGFSLSFLVFLVERITSMVKRNKVVKKSPDISDDPTLSINESVGDEKNHFEAERNVVSRDPLKRYDT
uniref:Uncharacterized protein n=1 Tax=Daphnia galeata TaxID=27404 RepID=A0A8J2RLU8_9CRUS|nr:unnamed protein product [Daphnia galeata]